METLNPYVPVLLLLLAAVVIATGMLGVATLIPRLFRLRKPSEAKGDPYECGMTPVGAAKERTSVKFYVVAMLFILFDVEAIFFYPWAVVHQDLGLYGLALITIFLLLLEIGFLYIWKRGALQWE